MTNPDDLATRLHSLATRVARGRLDTEEIDQLDELVSLFNSWSRRRRVLRNYGATSDAAHMRIERTRRGGSEAATDAVDEHVDGTRHPAASTSASVCENVARTQPASTTLSASDHVVTSGPLTSGDSTRIGSDIRRSTGGEL